MKDTAASDRSRVVAGGAVVPLHVPEGMTHLEYVLDEAEAAFLRGDRGSGVINLCHAVHVAASKGEPLPDNGWFQNITRAAKAWEL